MDEERVVKKGSRIRARLGLKSSIAKRRVGGTLSRLSGGGLKATKGNVNSKWKHDMHQDDEDEEEYEDEDEYEPVRQFRGSGRGRGRARGRGAFAMRTITIGVGRGRGRGRARGRGGFGAAAAGRGRGGKVVKGGARKDLPDECPW